MNSKGDQIKIEILPDGRLKATTDKVSAANHGSAEAIMRDFAQMGPTERKQRPHSHHHHGHEHGHTHSEH